MLTMLLKVRQKIKLKIYGLQVPTSSSSSIHHFLKEVFWGKKIWKVKGIFICSALIASATFCILTTTTIVSGREIFGKKKRPRPQKFSKSLGRGRFYTPAAICLPRERERERERAQNELRINPCYQVIPSGPPSFPY